MLEAWNIVIDKYKKIRGGSLKKDSSYANFTPLTTKLYFFFKHLTFDENIALIHEYTNIRPL